MELSSYDRPVEGLSSLALIDGDSGSNLLSDYLQNNNYKNVLNAMRDTSIESMVDSLGDKECSSHPTSSMNQCARDELL